MSATLDTHMDMTRTAQAAEEGIETARLRLRMFTWNDLDALCRIAEDPEVMRFIGGGQPLTREETHANLSSIISAFRRRGFGRWAVVLKETGTLAGYCGLSHGDQEVGVELAYMLGRGEWGKGLATEAARACLRYGFERLGFDSIAALTRPENLKSRRVMERLGMRFLRAGHHYGYNCVCYTVSRDEWHPDDSEYRIIT
jgi:RimJ/RimL family protein N-acetyltransferase